MRVNIPKCGTVLTLARPWTFHTEWKNNAWPLLAALEKDRDKWPSKVEHTFPPGTEFHVVNMYMNRTQSKIARLMVPMGRRRVHIWVERDNFNEMEVV